MLAKERLRITGTTLTYDLVYVKKMLPSSTTSKYIYIINKDGEMVTTAYNTLTEKVLPRLSVKTSSGEYFPAEHCAISISYIVDFSGEAGNPYVAGKYYSQGAIHAKYPPVGIQFRVDQVHSGSSSVFNYTKSTYLFTSQYDKTENRPTSNGNKESYPNTNVPSKINVTVNMYYRFSDTGPWIKFFTSNKSNIGYDEIGLVFRATNITRNTFNF